MSYPFPHPDFYKEEPAETASGMSTAAVFDLSRDLEGGAAWVSATRPGSGFKKKAVVITADWLKHSKGVMIALIQWLRLEGFPVVLCCSGEGFSHELIRLDTIRRDPMTQKIVNGSFDATLLDRLTYFRESDYPVLAKSAGVSQEMASVLNSSEIEFKLSKKLEWDKSFEIGGVLRANFFQGALGSFEPTSNDLFNPSEIQEASSAPATVDKKKLMQEIRTALSAEKLEGLISLIEKYLDFFGDDLLFFNEICLTLSESEYKERALAVIETLMARCEGPLSVDRVYELLGQDCGLYKRILFLKHLSPRYLETALKTIKGREMKKEGYLNKLGEALKSHPEHLQQWIETKGRAYIKDKDWKKALNAFPDHRALLSKMFGSDELAEPEGHYSFEVMGHVFRVDGLAQVNHLPNQHLTLLMIDSQQGLEFFLNQSRESLLALCAEVSLIRLDFKEGDWRALSQEQLKKINLQLEIILQECPCLVRMDLPEELSQDKSLESKLVQDPRVCFFSEKGIRKPIPVQPFGAVSLSTAINPVVNQARVASTGGAAVEPTLFSGAGDFVMPVQAKNPPEVKDIPGPSSELEAQAKSLERPKSESIAELTLEPRPEPIILASTTTALPTVGSKADNHLIYESDLIVSDSIDSISDKTQEYTYSATGRILHGQGQSVRHCVRVIKSDGKQLINLVSASPVSKLTRFEAASYEEKSYRPNLTEDVFEFTQSLKAGHKTKLKNMTPEDELKLYQTRLSSNVRFERDSAGFFYATASEDIELTYVIISPSDLVQSKLYAAIDSNDCLVKKIFEEYTDPASGFQMSTKELTLPERHQGESDSDWLHRVYEKRSGVCRHRAAALSNELKRRGVPENEYRIVAVKGDHTLLEFQHKDHWYRLDPGGGEAIEHYNPPPKNLLDKVTASMEPVSSIEDFHLSAQQEKILKLFERAVSKEIDSTALVKLVQCSARPVLIESSFPSSSVNQVVKACVDQGQEVFVIESMKDARLAGFNLYLDEDGKVDISSKLKFEKFLNLDHPNKVLVIDWSKLSPSECAAFNSVLDDPSRRCVGSRPVPGNIKIISVAESGARKDPSFLSRHESPVSLKFLSESASELRASETRAEQFEIDLGFKLDWQAALFGEIALDDNQPEWMQSDFSFWLWKIAFFADLEGKKIGLVDLAIKGVSPDQREAIEAYLERAKAQGFFEYQGRRFPVQINDFLIDSGMDFSAIQFSKLPTVRENIKELETAGVLINAGLFDILLRNKEVKDGFYTQTSGIIERAQNGNLQLFIASNLSDSQWMNLFQEAAKFNVELILDLAPEIRVPDGVRYQKLERVDREVEAAAASSPTIYFAQNAHATWNAVRSELPEGARVFDVEDLNSEELLGRIDHDQDKTTGQYQNFIFHCSEMIDCLKRGQDVILKGKFPDWLLMELAPLLRNPACIYENGEVKKLESKGQLRLIIEGTEQKKLFDWLPEDWIQTRTDSLPKIISEPMLEGMAEPEVLHEYSDDSAQAFIQNRKKLLKASLSTNPMIQLVGESGVGKSSLMREFEKTKGEEGVWVHRELSSLKAWAQDRSSGLKVLFIDESNILKSHLTRFGSLFEKPPYIIYQGEILELTAEHKVVFARNPKEYGGGRVDQKLFEDHGIPEIKLQDFPADYLYERIMKPVFEHSELTNSEAFREAAKLKLVRYFMGSNDTARELQQWALEYCVAQAQEGRLTRSASVSVDSMETASLSEPSIQLTPSQLKIQNDLDRFMNTREFLRAHPALKNTGLGGILIEGPSGVGKSEVVQQVLKAQGYRLLSFDQAQAISTLDSDIRIAVKLSASESVEFKKQVLDQALHKGWAVWIDEIDACLDPKVGDAEGLEKTLNAVLTGEDSQGKPAAQPGFCLVATGNGGGLSGRGIVSEALRHRLESIEMPAMTLDDMAVCVNQCLQPADPELVPQIAQDFLKIKAHLPDLTPREFLSKIHEVQSSYDLPSIASSGRAVLREAFVLRTSLPFSPPAPSSSGPQNFDLSTFSRLSDF